MTMKAEGGVKKYNDIDLFILKYDQGRGCPLVVYKNILISNLDSYRACMGKFTCQQSLKGALGTSVPAEYKGKTELFIMLLG